jgi:heme exporter protein CcmD
MTRIEVFFNMGGYAFFVWSAYLIALALMILILIYAYNQLRHKEAELKILQHSNVTPEDNIDLQTKKTTL